MKKTTLIVTIVATLALALMTTGYVFAQGNPAATPAGQDSDSWTGYGRGRMGRQGSGMGSMAIEDTLLHDSMIAYFAQELGISVEDLSTRLDQGETMVQIASSAGLSTEEIDALMSEARSLALDQAVSDGTITQEQADWLKERGRGMDNTGMETGRRGMRGSSAECTGTPQTNP